MTAKLKSARRLIPYAKSIYAKVEIKYIGSTLQNSVAVFN